MLEQCSIKAVAKLDFVIWGKLQLMVNGAKDKGLHSLKVARSEKGWALHNKQGEAIASLHSNLTFEDSIVDLSHPLYLHSSNKLGILLVSKHFDGTGFHTGFVTGKISRAEASSSLVAAWNHCNFIIMKWILNTLSKDIAESLIYISTTQEMWLELMDRFEQSNGTLIF
ncbi:hypothetical protein L6164_012214 [Bauhinia variegata]|uniref:Uncharacterized protein n=1 Tax=Bauhinia variegata TaxID=167791 RepID=A0ACB9PC79_BAUVA|nr:hypothetical protein L6164_012214 [Bauhinia variegata]